MTSMVYDQGWERRKANFARGLVRWQIATAISHFSTVSALLALTVQWAFQPLPVPLILAYLDGGLLGVIFSSLGALYYFSRIHVFAYAVEKYYWHGEKGRLYHDYQQVPWWTFTRYENAVTAVLNRGYVDQRELTPLIIGTFLGNFIAWPLAVVWAVGLRMFNIRL